MKKLWFYFNTIQVADTFTEFSNVKPPANVAMLQKAYKDIINVKVVPDPVADEIKANLGMPKKQVNETEQDEPEEDELTEMEREATELDGTRRLEVETGEAVAIDPNAEAN